MLLSSLWYEVSQVVRRLESEQVCMCGSRNQRYGGWRFVYHTLNYDPATKYRFTIVSVVQSEMSPVLVTKYSRTIELDFLLS